MYLLWSETAAQGIFAFFANGLFIGLLCTFLFQVVGTRIRFRSRREFVGVASRKLPVLIFLMAFMGAAVGIAGGWSRTGVVGDLMPAVLGFAGGLAVYLFGTKNRHTFIVVPSLFSFTISVFSGFVLGSELRSPVENYHKYRDLCFDAFSDAEIMSSEDAYCRFFSGAGSQCWRVLFHNNLDARKVLSSGAKTYIELAEHDRGIRIDHLLLECEVRNKKRELELLEFVEKRSTPSQ